MGEQQETKEREVKKVSIFQTINEGLKMCSKCGENKSVSSYYKDISKPSKLRSDCKECSMLVKRKYYDSNKERINKELWKRVKNCPDRLSESRRRKREYNLSTKGILKQKQWKVDNKDKIKNYRDKMTESQKMLEVIRKQLNRLIKYPKSRTSLEYLGCSKEYFKKHLENLFLEGMGWDNYGRKGWHIDHIKPCASFNLTQEEEIRKCFHYTNLQPLWEKDNLKKGSLYKGKRYYSSTLK